MKKKLFALVFVTHSVLFSLAQDFRLNLSGGLANYIGDLQSKQFTKDQSRSTLGLWASYNINQFVMLRGGFHYTSLGAHDRFQVNPLNRLRNLSFQTNLYELHAGAELHFLGMDQYVFSPYGFLGVAGFYYNPYSFDPAGNKVFLKPLSTEGQGLPGYDHRKAYSLMQFAIPFGVGFRVAVTDRIGMGAEFSFRKTFTDYLDDVSTTYVDQTVLLANRGIQAVEMSFRTPELPTHGNDPYPQDGRIRGGKDKKDNYYYLGLTLSYRITGESTRKSGRGRRSSFSCPTNIF